MTENNSKPEPIRISVQGVEPEPIIMGGTGPTQIQLLLDWSRVMGLPPFQTFMSEVCQLSFDTVDDWLQAKTFALIQQCGEMTFFDQYATWHRSKPYWENETPWGEIKNEANAD